MKSLRLIFALAFLCSIMACSNREIVFEWGDTDIHYEQGIQPTELTGQAFRYKVWRGEKAFAQAVLWTPADLSNLRVWPSNLYSGFKAIGSRHASAGFVHYVMADVLNEGYRQCGARKPGQFDSLLVADRVGGKRLKELKAGNCQPIWITIDVPHNAKPGIYKGRLNVRCREIGRRSIPFEIEVVDKVLPEAKDWKFHLDLWQNPYSVARYHDVELWSEEHFELMRPLMTKLAQAGQKVITTTILERPWNGQTQDAYGSMVRKIRQADGRMKYDYTIFDKWVEFMMEVGIDDYISCYSMIPWRLSFDYIDEATGETCWIEADPQSNEYKLYWGEFLGDFAMHLREKGWFEKTMIAMDERPADAMQAAFEVIFNADPDFKVSLAGNWHPEIERNLHDYCVGFRHDFPSDIRQQRSAEGKVSTWYTCCAERFPNTFVVSPLDEAVWIPWRTLAAGFDGYLRWAFNHWTIDPVADARFRKWPAGDCYCIYPNAESSLRFDRMVEGIQDYEKALILMEEWKKNGEEGKLAVLSQALKIFTFENIEAEGAGPAVHKAKAALQQ